MECNKDGKLKNRYYKLDEILKLDLDKETVDNIKDKFGKRVYFDSNGDCKVGRLCGIEKNYQFGMIYYIIVDSNDRKMFVPIHQSISSL